jgi:hypothetical protein
MLASSMLSLRISIRHSVAQCHGARNSMPEPNPPQPVPSRFGALTTDAWRHHDECQRNPKVDYMILLCSKMKETRAFYKDVVAQGVPIIRMPTDLPE